MKKTYRTNPEKTSPQRNLALADAKKLRQDTGDGIASDSAVERGKKWVDSNEK
jgi:hypothetical protein